MGLKPATAHLDATGVGPNQAVEHAQQRRLPRPIRSDEPEALSASEFEADIPEGPELIFAQLAGLAP